MIDIGTSGQAKEAEKLKGSKDDKGSNETSPSAMSLKEYVNLYEIYRAYAMQESNLINSRITWILAIHGFLYATYGFTLQKELEVASHIHIHHRPNMLASVTDPVAYVFTQAEFFLGLITIVGGAISIFGLISIMAAQNASHSIDFIFSHEKNVAHKFMNLGEGPIDGNSHTAYITSDGYFLPNIRGGGQYKNVKNGHIASKFIPWILAGSWAMSLLTLLYFGYRNKSILRFW